MALRIQCRPAQSALEVLKSFEMVFCWEKSAVQTNIIQSSPSIVTLFDSDFVMGLTVCTFWGVKQRCHYWFDRTQNGTDNRGGFLFIVNFKFVVGRVERATKTFV